VLDFALPAFSPYAQTHNFDFPALPGDFSLNLGHHMEVTIMTENILETIKKGVQDFVAPEVR
jgi:hypothetical protein